jgi:hypothetical protein
MMPLLVLALLASPLAAWTLGRVFALERREEREG